jgi:hypothetical protein
MGQNNQKMDQNNQKMSTKNVDVYDVFISYQWHVKSSVRKLYKQLTEVHGLKCWMDDFDMGSGDLNESKNIIHKRLIAFSLTHILKFYS